MRRPTPCGFFYDRMRDNIGLEKKSQGSVSSPTPASVAVTDDRTTRNDKLTFYGPNIIRVHVTPAIKLIVSEAGCRLIIVLKILTSK